MVRLVVSYLLVLSLLAGPMLCCCTATRVDRERTAVASQPPRKHCCGGTSSSHNSQKTPSEKPSDPGKCPCKEGGAKVIAAPESAPVSVASLTLLLTSDLAVDPPLAHNTSLVTVCGGPRFDHRSSSPSASELLYAHHNLRC